MAQMMEFFLDGLENILEKGESAAYQHFFFHFPTMF